MNNYNIINGDMLSEVYNLKPKSVDFILVDPPYGRKFIEIELDKNYFDIAQKRIEEKDNELQVI